MNAQTLILIIQIIKMIQAAKVDKSVASALIDANMDGSSKEKAVLLDELITLDLSFISDFFNGILQRKD
jgi:hypothetical protein